METSLPLFPVSYTHCAAPQPACLLMMVWRHATPSHFRPALPFPLTKSLFSFHSILQLISVPHPNSIATRSTPPSMLKMPTQLPPTLATLYTPLMHSNHHQAPSLNNQPTMTPTTLTKPPAQSTTPRVVSSTCLLASTSHPSFPTLSPPRSPSTPMRPPRKLQPTMTRANSGPCRHTCPAAQSITARTTRQAHSPRT